MFSTTFFQTVAMKMVSEGKGGSIVNISSHSALNGLLGHTCYSAAKAGLDSFTRVAAVELGKNNVRKFSFYILYT